MESSRLLGVDYSCLLCEWSLGGNQDSDEYRMVPPILLNRKMRKIVLLLANIISVMVINAQVSDANYVVDYSQALICGVDEETFSEIEKDWNKDKSAITDGLIQGMFDILKTIIPYKKKSSNKIIVLVRSITKNGAFNCDITLHDSNGTIIAQATNIECMKGAAIGTKLRLMKVSSKKEGHYLGRALKDAFTQSQ